MFAILAVEPYDVNKIGSEVLATKKTTYLINKLKNIFSKN